MSTPGWVQRTTTVPNSRSNGTTRARIVGLPRTAPLPPYRAITLPPHRAITLPPHRATTLPPHRATTMPPYTATTRPCAPSYHAARAGAARRLRTGSLRCAHRTGSRLWITDAANGGKS